MHLAKVRLTEVNNDPGKAEILLEGNLDINSVSLIHQHFVDIVHRYREVTVNICNVEKVDISFIQLYYAFKLSAKKQGIVVRDTIELEDELSTLIGRAGINLQDLFSENQLKNPK